MSGTVVVAGGGDAAYYALDADTGERLWRVPLVGEPSAFAWASPLLAHGRVYYGAASSCDDPSIPGELVALGLDGSTLAARRFVPEGDAGAGIWNSPALSPDGGTLIVATGEDFEGYDGPYNRAIVSLDPLTLAARDPRPLAVISRVSPQPLPQRLRRHPQLLGDRLDRRPL